jgi:hypothetical protein
LAVLPDKKNVLSNEPAYPPANVAVLNKSNVAISKSYLTEIEAPLVCIALLAIHAAALMKII